MGYDPFDIRALGLERVVPRRKFRKGTKPGVTGKEPLGREVGDEVRWVFPKTEPTELEKRKLLAAALEMRETPCGSRRWPWTSWSSEVAWSRSGYRQKNTFGNTVSLMKPTRRNITA